MTTEQMDAIGIEAPKPSRLRKAIAQSERSESVGGQPDSLDGYETVATRLARFWRSHTKGRIITEIVETSRAVSNGQMRWVVKASVWKDKTNGETVHPAMPDATGYATETDGHGDDITAASALETAETSAIGRALANLGKTGKSPRPTREGMERTATKIEAAKKQ